MIYSLSLRDDQLQELIKSFSNHAGDERAAYLFCNRSVTKKEIRFVVSDIEVVQLSDIASCSPNNVGIKSESYTRALAKSERENKSFFLVHSHPKGFESFSKQDDVEETSLFRTVFIRSPNGPHGSLVIADIKQPVLFGRAWINEKKNVKLSRIRVIGKRLHIYQDNHDTFPSWADRQVKAFGQDIQDLLKSLHVGIVGAGGTGSSVAEQLIRIGVGEITVIDPDSIEATNVTRVYGSTLKDIGKPKVEVIRSLGRKIGFGTKINAFQASLLDKDTSKSLRDCDFIFGCTDDHTGRSILTRFPYWYYIPVIDMGVFIDSHEGHIKDITGRVTTLTLDNPCLNCRNAVSASQINAETLKFYSPQEFKERVKEGYAPELASSDPAIIMFTTSVAARAVSEFIHMLTGYMGEERKTSEVRERFHETEVRSIGSLKKTRCTCSDLGKADTRLFLGRLWR